jgi:hypothetical protein
MPAAMLAGPLARPQFGRLAGTGRVARRHLKGIRRVGRPREQARRCKKTVDNRSLWYSPGAQYFGPDAATAGAGSCPEEQRVYVNVLMCVKQ